MTVVTDVVTRGNTVHITANFTDVNGNPAAPANAGVALNYSAGTTVVEVSYPLTYSIANGVWYYYWDSSVAQPGTVQWSVYSDLTAQPTYVADGSFLLEANTPNLAAI